MAAKERREEAFCLAFTALGNPSCGNATESAIVAGFGKGNRASAASQGKILLKRESVRKRIAELQAQTAGKAGVSRERWLERMTEIFEQDAKDRVAAGVALGKAQEFFPAEKHEVSGKGGGPLVVEVIRYADAAAEPVSAEAVPTPAPAVP